jgi:hypothetical protein
MARPKKETNRKPGRPKGSTKKKVTKKKVTRKPKVEEMSIGELRDLFAEKLKAAPFDEQVVLLESLHQQSGIRAMAFYLGGDGDFDRLQRVCSKIQRMEGIGILEFIKQDLTLSAVLSQSKY